MDVDSTTSEPAGGGGGENHRAESSSSNNFPMLLPRHKHEAICQAIAAEHKARGLEGATKLLAAKLAVAFLRHEVKYLLHFWTRISSPVGKYFQEVYQSAFETTPTEDQLRELLDAVAVELDMNPVNASTHPQAPPLHVQQANLSNVAPPSSSATPAAPPAASDAPES